VNCQTILVKKYIHFNLKESIYLLKELLLCFTNYKNLINYENLVIPVVILINQIIYITINGKSFIFKLFGLKYIYVFIY